MTYQPRFQDDGGSPAWRARRDEQNSIGRLLAGPIWMRWSPMRRLVWCFVAPWFFGCGVLAGTICGVLALEVIGVLH